MTEEKSPRLTAAIELLKQLIATPSPSRQEGATANILQQWLVDAGVEDVRRIHNNVFALCRRFDRTKPTLMLNSHHDTVRPSASYTRNPYEPAIEQGRLYGLGSNDAGGACVALASTFVELYDNTDLPFNLLLALSAAEEVMAPEGMRALLPHLAEAAIVPDMAIVGEPTDMQPAVGERGLMVLDGVADGVAGHAARSEGINAIYRAIADIERLRAWEPPKRSSCLGPIKVSVTMIEAGTQHNVVPDKCRYTVDVRTTDAYSNEVTLGLLRQVVHHTVLTPRSTHIQASALEESHPLVQAAMAMHLTPFVSPTTSDMALMRGIPALKIGPGSSSRSHSADEFIYINELNNALIKYPQLICQAAKIITENG